MFLKEIRNIFVSRTQILCPQQMLRARANGGNICVRNIVSSFATALKVSTKTIRLLPLVFYELLLIDCLLIEASGSKSNFSLERGSV